MDKRIQRLLIAVYLIVYCFVFAIGINNAFIGKFWFSVSEITIGMAGIIFTLLNYEHKS